MRICNPAPRVSMRAACWKQTWRKGHWADLPASVSSLSKRTDLVSERGIADAGILFRASRKLSGQIAPERRSLPFSLLVTRYFPFCLCVFTGLGAAVLRHPVFLSRHFRQRTHVRISECKEARSVVRQNGVRSTA